MAIERKPGKGLFVRESEYLPLKAFASGGFYWDTGPQNLIRTHLGSFLPALTRENDERGASGLYHLSSDGASRLASSLPLGQQKVPADQLNALAEAIHRLKSVADARDTIPDYRVLVSKFQLPDPSRDPELYRLSGPFWNRRLHILWGCEKVLNSSISAEKAIALLEPDPYTKLKKWLVPLGLLLVLLALLAALLWGWPHLKRAYAKAFNKPPVAALKRDALDETNLVATVSDDGSHDPDGTIQQWLLAWGDGQEERLSVAPKSVPHTYAAERDYQISLWVVDNFGATSAPPATVDAKFDFLQRERVKAMEAKAREDARAAEEARRQADEARQKAEEQARAAEAKNKQAEADARAAAEAKKKADEYARAAAEAKQKADEDAKAAEESRKKAEAQAIPQPPSTPATNTNSNSNSGPNPNAPWTEPPAPKTRPPGSSMPPPGGQQQVESLIAVEIQKSNVGGFDAEGRLEAILVVRDTKFPNAPLQILSWEIDGKTEKSGNAQYTVKLPVGTHKVNVNVVRSTMRKIASAEVIVSAEQKQTTETNLKVIPLK